MHDARYGHRNRSCIFSCHLRTATNSLCTPHDLVTSCEQVLHRSNTSRTALTNPSSRILSLHVMVRHLSPEARVPSMLKPGSTVYCTPNFLFGTEIQDYANEWINDYLRPVDAALIFANGDMLLLSEREADGVLEAFSASESNSPYNAKFPTLVHISYTTSEPDGKQIELNPLLKTAVTAMQKMSARATYSALARIWVYSGITNIPSDGQQEVKALTRGESFAVRHLIAARGKERMLPRSDLERLLM